MSKSNCVVAVHSRCNIVPAVATPQPCVRKLSNLDLQLCGNAFVSQVFYYKPSKLTRGVTEAGLKESLSNTLVRYYLLAGRPERDAVTGRYHINCNDTGTPFLMASTQARFDDWDDIRHCSLQEQLNPPQQLTSDIDSAPLLQVQVTKFACGGIAIGYTVSEMVVDGHSSYQFFATWARVNSCMTKGDVTGLANAPYPSFNLGELLEARQPLGVTNVPLKNLVTVSQDVLQVLEEYEMKVLLNKHEHKRFTMDATCVDALIQEIEQGPFTTFRKVTSFEALSALLWTCITQARELPDDAVTKFAYPISFRNNSQRWCPSIPEDCFGNAVHVSCLLAKEGEIKSKHISYAASLIHKDLRSVSMEIVL